MKDITPKFLGLVFLAMLAGLSSHAQNSQLLPEVDVYGKVGSNLRLWFQAKQTREEGSPAQAEIGPSLDFSIKPFLHLSRATEFDLDDSKSRPFVFSIGYRYLPEANGAPASNRMEALLTINFPLKERSCSPTEIAAISTGKTASSPGVIATGFNLKGPSDGAHTTFHRTLVLIFTVR